MTWDWIASASTGLVGIAGIAATWLTARQSQQVQAQMIRDEAELTSLRDRRQLIHSVYSNTLGTFNQFMQQATLTNGLIRATQKKSEDLETHTNLELVSDKIRSELFETRSAALASASSIGMLLGELSLVAPPAISQQARIAQTRVLLILSAAVHTPDDDMATFEPAIKDILELERLMREEVNSTNSTEVDGRSQGPHL